MNKNLKKVIIDISSHLMLALIGSGFIYFGFRNMLYAFSFFVGSIFIDLDHLIDYFLYDGFRFSLKRFLSLEYLRAGKVYIVLHSWEIFFVLFISSIIFRLDYLFFFSLGMAVHLVFDTFHRIRPLFYCLIYRAHKKFDANFLCPECLESLT